MSKKTPPPLPRIVQVGNPVLRNVAEAVPVKDIKTPKIQKLIQTMIEVMREAPGVGLAAPQIGVGLQVIVLEDPEETMMTRLSSKERDERGRVPLALTVIINPKLTVVKHSKKPGKSAGPTFYEGCLSLDGFKALVERAEEVRVEGWNEKGEPIEVQATGWPARILQHECDHVQGKIFIDRMDSRSFCSLNEEALLRNS